MVPSRSGHFRFDTLVKHLFIQRTFEEPFFNKCVMPSLPPCTLAYIDLKFLKFVYLEIIHAQLVYSPIMVLQVRGFLH